jgi:conflict system pore-forming effector with SLATT domain
MEIAPFVHDAGIAAARQQRAFLWTNRIQLGLVLLAAAFGVASFGNADVDWSGVVAATFLGVSLLLRVVMMQRGDERAWFTARQAAEVSKSLCFQYAFGATGFERSLPPIKAEEEFIEQFGDLGRDVLLEQSMARTDGYSEVTDDMRAMRSAPFEEAKHAYFELRIRDQERWYSTKGAFHLRRTRIWTTLMLIAQVLGMFFAILKAVSFLDGPFGGLVGLMSALAAAFLAWSQLRQHSSLSSTYQNQAVILRDFGRRLPLVTESKWPSFVTQVENSLITEHNRWQGLQGKR